MLKKIVAIGCAAILCTSPIIVTQNTGNSFVTSAFAADNEYSYKDKYGVTYSFTVDASDNTACLTGLTNAKADLILPSAVSSNGKTYTVTKIGDYFAKKNTVIKSVTIPDSIYIIGHGSFNSATNLTNVYGANSIIEVGYNSFISTEWDNNLEDTKGYCILGKALFKYYSKNETIDLSSNEFDKIEYICAGTFSGSYTAKKMILPKNLSCISIDALQSHTSMNSSHRLNEVKFYDKSLKKYVDLYDVCMSDNKNAFQSEFLYNFYESFSHTPLCDRITLDYTKNVFKDYGIKYIGSTNNTGYTAFEEYQIVRKLYIFIGQNYTHYNCVAGKSSSFKSEIFYRHGIMCEDYADMFNYFCDAAGIQCVKVSSSPGGSHAWNNVNIGGQWFNVDSCWTWNWSLTGFLTTDNVIKDGMGAHTKNAKSSNFKCTTQIGDVNRDGYIDSVDAAQIMKAFSSLASSTPTNKFSSFDLVLCDVDRNGYVDSVDASRVLAYYSYISTFKGSEVPSIEQYISDKGYNII